MTPSYEFGLYVKKTREALKMSQNDLSRATKISQGWISKIESGRTVITLDHAVTLMEALEHRKRKLQ